MRGSDMMAKNVYTTKEVADNLGIVTSTLRKWCLMVENERIGDYKFERNLKDQRVFYDYDMLALRQVKKLTTEDGILLEDAVKSVADKLRAQKEIRASVIEEEEEVIAPSPDIQAKIDKLLEYIERQDERFDQQERFNRELLSKLDDQQKYIQESLKARDEQLMIAIRETQETKRLIAAAEEAKPEPKKGFFARLFGK
jgi:DNA-binding transcriptional MerR regulator